MNNECRGGGGARLETADTRGFSNDNPPRRRFILRVDTYRIWNFPTRGIDRLENRSLKDEKISDDVEFLPFDI